MTSVSPHHDLVVKKHNEFTATRLLLESQWTEGCTPSNPSKSTLHPLMMMGKKRLATGVIWCFCGASFWSNVVTFDTALFVAFEQA